jgi:hypothetical protein
MLKILDKFGLPSVIILYILNWLLKIKYVLYPELPQLGTCNGVLKFPVFNEFMLSHNILYTVLSIHFIFFIALIINYLWLQEKMASKNSLLPALSIIIVSSLLSAGFMLSIHTFLGLLLIMATYLLFLSNTGKGTTTKLYVAGCIMGIAILVQNIFVIMAVALLIVITILRAINLRAITAYILGIASPIYLFLGVLWCINPSLISKINWLNIYLPKEILHKESLLFSLVVIIWLVFHTYFLKQKVSEIGGIQIQKKWMSLRLIWVALFIISLLVTYIPNGAFTTWMLFSALLVFQSFNTALNNKWANFTFVFLILVIFFNQWVFE